jgi:hypothetical protein
MVLVGCCQQALLDQQEHQQLPLVFQLVRHKCLQQVLVVLQQQLVLLQQVVLQQLVLLLRMQRQLQ